MTPKKRQAKQTDGGGTDAQRTDGGAVDNDAAGDERTASGEESSETDAWDDGLGGSDWP
jgi:hypothetical protein